MTGFAYKPQLVQVCCIFLLVLVLAIIADDELLPHTYVPDHPQPVTLSLGPQEFFVPIDPKRPGPGPAFPDLLDLRPTMLAGATAAVPSGQWWSDSA